MLNGFLAALWTGFAWAILIPIHGCGAKMNVAICLSDAAAVGVSLTLPLLIWEFRSALSTLPSWPVLPAAVAAAHLHLLVSIYVLNSHF